MRDDRSDLVVIGAGIAGLIAANRAAELGLRCTVLERGEGQYVCNTRLTGGMFHICMKNIARPSDESFRSILQAVPDLPSHDLARAVAENGERMVRWLRRQGVRLIKAGPDEAYWWVLAPPRTMQIGMPWKGRAGDVMMHTLEEGLIRRGGAIVRGAHAEALCMTGGVCTGVEAVVQDARRTFQASAVVIADGGFQSNLSMLRHYITPKPESLFQRCAPGGNGDGIRMAQALGAKTVGMSSFYGHVLNRAVFSNPALWPYPIMDRVVAAGIAVDAHGVRFMDEGLGGVYQANQIAKMADPLSAVAIFDAEIWHQAGRQSKLSAPNPALIKRGGVLWQATDLPSLARLAGLPPDALCSTIEAYNAAVRSQATAELSPARSPTKFKPAVIATQPFFAAPLCAGITYTMGGIATDASARVIDQDDCAIPGLYAAGCTTGGLEGGAMAGYVGGLVKSGTMAMLAAESIAAARLPVPG